MSWAAARSTVKLDLVAGRATGSFSYMSTTQSVVFEALRAIDIPEDKALKAASALSRRDEDVSLSNEIWR